DYKGLMGLYRLSKELKTRVAFDAVADIHDVLRTKVLRNLLGKPTAVINKGRAEKKELTRKTNKKLRPLPTAFERMTTVFGALGLPVDLNINDGYTPKHSGLDFPRDSSAKISIGIAPFAKHAAKMYPLPKLERVVDLLLQVPNLHIYFFASKGEMVSLESLRRKSDRIHNMDAVLSFGKELELISQMDAMITMDSANMHLASLFGVPVVSIWGGTHPFLGFYGWGQDYENIVQVDLPCRPSSVFGNKSCPVHGAAGCMQDIQPKMIFDKVMEVVST
ncbi:MAG: lipopolysaccharide heptosyltransferase family protein, partial [Chitinophagaceae bacterium]